MCGELVSDVENCANCANDNPLRLHGYRNPETGQRGAWTLDMQEGNWEEWHGGVGFSVKAFRE